MADDLGPPDLGALRKWLHELNNRVGVILATSELLQLDQLTPRAAERCRTIEGKAIEVRDLLRSISEHYFP